MPPYKVLVCNIILTFRLKKEKENTPLSVPTINSLYPGNVTILTVIQLSCLPLSLSASETHTQTQSHHRNKTYHI